MSPPNLIELIGGKEKFVETSRGTRDFISIAMAMGAAAADGSGLTKLADVARRKGASPRVVTLIENGGLMTKSPVAGAALNTTTGDALADFQTIASAFLDSLRSVGCFDRMLSSMKAVPLRGRAVVTTLGGTGSLIGPTIQIKPLTSLSLAGVEIELRIALAALVLSNEVWKLGEAGTADLVRRELSLAVARVTDEAMVSELTSGLTGMASEGATALAIMQDVSKLLGALTLSKDSKVFILVEPATAVALSTKTAATSASFVFNQMSPTGGFVANVPVLVCDGLSAGQMLAVDANQVAAASEDVSLSRLTQGDVQMDTAPNSPPGAAGVLTSMWQHNLTAIKLERRFGIEKLRVNAAALVTGVNYATSNSPA